MPGVQALSTMREGEAVIIDKPEGMRHRRRVRVALGACGNGPGSAPRLVPRSSRGRLCGE